MATANEHIKKAQALIIEAQLLQKSLIPPPEPIIRATLVLSVLNGIPLFSGLLKRLNSTHSIVSTLTKKTDNVPLTIPDVAKAAPFIGIALNVLDFIQIPLLYLAAFILGEKLPHTLTNNARWIYASVILALCVIAAVVPVTAPFIAITSASLGMIAGVVTLAYLFTEYSHDKKNLKEVTEKISLSPSGQLTLRILELDRACNDPNKDSLLIEKLISDIEQLRMDCIKQSNEIKALYKEAQLLENKLNIEFEIMDNAIGISLSALAVSGTVVSLFFPPAGLIVLLTTALAGGAYIMARLLVPEVFSIPVNQSEVPIKNEQIPVYSDDLLNDSTKKLLATLTTKAEKRKLWENKSVHTNHSSSELNDLNDLGEHEQDRKNEPTQGFKN